MCVYNVFIIIIYIESLHFKNIKETFVFAAKKWTVIIIY